MLVFDRNKALAQVRELREIAEELRSMRIRTLAGAVSSVDACWKGEVSKRFLDCCGEFHARLEKEEAVISDIADSLEATTVMIEKKERETARMLAMNK